jgi:hypothetical protein
MRRCRAGAFGQFPRALGQGLERRVAGKVPDILPEVGEVFADPGEKLQGAAVLEWGFVHGGRQFLCFKTMETRPGASASGSFPERDQPDGAATLGRRYSSGNGLPTGFQMPRRCSRESDLPADRGPIARPRPRSTGRNRSRSSELRLQPQRIPDNISSSTRRIAARAASNSLPNQRCTPQFPGIPERDAASWPATDKKY